jgi:hypothetical protein
MSEKVKKQTPKIKLMFGLLFEKHLRDLGTGDITRHIQRIPGRHVSGIQSKHLPPEIVRDFIAGMTDEFLRPV